MRRSGQLCDLVIDAGGRRLRAHKVSRGVLLRGNGPVQTVLSAVIPYFRLMFTTDMLEASQKVVTIHGNLGEDGEDQEIQNWMGTRWTSWSPTPTRGNSRYRPAMCKSS